MVNHLKRLAKRIQVVLVNTKSSAFNRRFISAEGIKDREWYKHLTVAPGKWLGSHNFCLLFFFGLFAAELEMCSF